MIFNHKSVLLNETVDSLCVKPQGIYWEAAVTRARWRHGWETADA